MALLRIVVYKPYGMDSVDETATVTVEKVCCRTPRTDHESSFTRGGPAAAKKAFPEGADPEAKAPEQEDSHRPIQ
jgi:hypothetical protein